MVQQGKLFGNGRGCWELRQLRAESQAKPKIIKTKNISNAFRRTLTSKSMGVRATYMHIIFVND